MIRFDRPLFMPQRELEARLMPFFAEAANARMAEVAAARPQNMAAKDDFDRYLESLMEDRVGTLYDRASGVGIICVGGMLCAGASVWEEYVFGMYNTDRIPVALEEMAAQPGLRGVVLAMNSPGGYIGGVVESAELVAGFEAAPLAVYAKEACSAAYWIAAGADGIWAPKSAPVGSIGVYCAVADYSKMWEARGIEWHFIRDGKFKGMGDPRKDWTKDELEMLESQLMASSREFKGWVSEHRGVEASAMEGQWWAAKDAPKGFVDGVEHATLEKFMQAFVSASLRK